MSRPGAGPVPTIPQSQPNVPPTALPAGNTLNAPSAAPTAGAIGRALGAGTSDQEKVLLFLYYYYQVILPFLFIPPKGCTYNASTSAV